MKYLYRNVLILLLGLFLGGSMGEMFALDYYRRHYILVVDETPEMYKDASSDNMRSIYYYLYHSFAGTSFHFNGDGYLSTDLKFDPTQDEISLFVFGLPGASGHENTPYGEIKRSAYRAKNSKDENASKDAYLLFLKNYIYPRATYSSVGNLDKFFKEKVQNLFFGKDPLLEQIKEQSCVTLSKFVFPCILEPQFFQNEIPATEYVLLIVSNFQSGTNDKGTSQDYKRIQELFSEGNVIKYFNDRINKWESLFFQFPILSVSYGEAQTKPILLGYTLGVKSMAGTSIYLTSNIQMVQSGISNDFTLSPAKVFFKHNEQLKIERITTEIKNRDGKVFGSLSENNTATLSSWCDGIYVNIPEQDIEVSRLAPLEDTMKVQYTFYTRAYDKDGVPLITYAFTVERQMLPNEDVILTDIKRTKMIGITISIIAVVLLLMWLILRGRKKRIKTTVGHFPQKYVNVTATSGAVKKSCWFHKEGSNKRSIHVSGVVTNKNTFSLGRNFQLYVRLQGGTPKGFSYFVNGKGKGDGDWIKIKPDGKNFSFNIDIEVDPTEASPNKLHDCAVTMDFLVKSTLFGVQTFEDVLGEEQVSFYFHGEVGNSWVGIDPGTTGSCVAIGCPSGALSDPAISMMSVRKGTEISNVIPSRLVLPRNIKVENRQVTELIPNVDYKYGVDADLNWEASSRDGDYCYQSIKKLLGYKKGSQRMLLSFQNGQKLAVSGLELAHLLVKGLDNELNIMLNGMSSAERTRLTGNPKGSPQRAVVAIPNNYTLPKTLDMVDSVRKLNKYKEVRFIYEAEGVLFNYFRKRFSQTKPGSEVIMVYDMGGATINISIFKVNYQEDGGQIHYDVHTLARIGYGVGGDNIDVALMEFIFHLNKIVREGNADSREVQRKNRDFILKKIFDLKQALINYSNHGQNIHEISTRANFVDLINEVIKDFGHIGVDAFDDSIKDFASSVFDSVLGSKALRTYVFNNVKDAMQEILSYPELQNVKTIDTLIFAGRSTLFPHVRGSVRNLLNQKFKKVAVYNGFTDEEIKTSVAYGACWYGVYNSLVNLDNTRLSCIYGYKFTSAGKTHLKPLLNQNFSFVGEKPLCGSEQIRSSFAADGNVIYFYQVMGSGRDEDIFSSAKRHKVNYIGEIQAIGATEQISMSVGRNDLVDCMVRFDSGAIETLSEIQVTNRDITNENDWAYVFHADSSAEICSSGNDSFQMEDVKEGNASSQKSESHGKLPRKPSPKKAISATRPTKNENDDISLPSFELPDSPNGNPFKGQDYRNSSRNRF